MLAYLALNSDRRHTREKLATLLWGDRFEEQGRQSLRQCLRTVRKALGDEYASFMVSEGDHLALDPGGVEVDAHTFEQLAGTNERESLEQALALYRGDLLEGLNVKSEPFEEWLRDERIRLRQCAHDTLERLATLYGEAGDPEAAIATAQRLLALDPVRESVHRMLMRLYEGTGRRSAALQQYQTCGDALRRELDVEPDPETVRLFSEIRTRQTRAGVAPGDTETVADVTVVGETTADAAPWSVSDDEAAQSDTTVKAEPPVRTPRDGASRGIERRLAAIVSADVVGYSHLMGVDEVATRRTLKAHHDELIDPKITEHRGRLVGTAGDSWLIEFASIVDAVQWAVDVQRAMAERNSSVSADRRMELRVGVNLGDVIVEGDDIHGEGVNVAARLQSLAEPGGICISRKVFEETRDRFGLGFEDLGERWTKNISRPLRVYRLLTAPQHAGRVIVPARKSAIPWRWVVPVAAIVILAAVAVANLQSLGPWSPNLETASIERMTFPLPDKPSIAVLPFQNLTGDPAEDGFIDGITDDITTVLSTISEMFVIDRGSAFTYKGKTVKVQQVAEELGVRYVLEGSVKRSGDRVRISAQLIDALTGHHLWAELYDREVEDIFTLQDEITLEIVTALQVEMTEGDQERISLMHGTSNLQAWILVGRGLQLARHLTREDNTKARELHREATQLDPSFPGGWDGLAWTHFIDAWFGWSESRAASMLRAAELAQKAFALDPTRGRTYALLGMIQLMNGNHEQAVALGEKAVTLNPSGSEVAALLALILSYTGELERGIALIQRAMRLSPYYPDWYRWNLGRIYRLMGRYEDAVTALTARLDDSPDSLVPRIELVATYVEMDREADAFAEATEVLRINPDFSVREWTAVQPYKDPAAAKREMNVLRKAGLPE